MARWHALWMKPVLAPDIERELNVERLLALVRLQPVAAVAHSVNSAILGIAAWPYFRNAGLIALVASVQIAALWQLHMWRSRRGRSRPSEIKDRTISRIVAWAGAYGLLWGFLRPLWLFPCPTRMSTS